MTEVERIIKDRGFSANLLKEETICDFYVDIKRKKTWIICLDLLLFFDDFCKKNGLAYYLMFGTLLGAVRHQGFVPWDDDIDVVMPREDYNKLKSLRGNFDEPYFLQIPGDDNHYFYSYIKIRNSRTSSLSKGLFYCSFNKGISIDVFCIDNWKDDNEGCQLYNDINRLILEQSRYMKSFDPKSVFFNPNREFKTAYQNMVMIEKLCQLFNQADTNIVCLPNIQAYGYSKNLFLKEWFGVGTKLTFMGFSFPAPSEYQKILEVIYGKYMEFPPIESRGKWHTAYVDPDKDFSFYKNIEKEQLFGE